LPGLPILATVGCAFVNNPMLSVEQNTKLLKLHLQWPERNKFRDDPGEALAFFRWLFLNHSNRPEILSLDTIDEVEDFLTDNHQILRPLPSVAPAVDRFANLRREPRIENDVLVALTVNECAADHSRIGVCSTGRSLDLGLHGMRLIIDKDLPSHSLLELKLTPDNGDVFRLTGNTRWITTRDDHYLMGLRIIEDDGFEYWRSQFGARFVTPNLSPSKVSGTRSRPQRYKKG
jgi:hypothetical protein